MARREAILDKALDVIAQQGTRGASVKEIADAVGLSPAGLLHYFDSKEELFTEIVRKRDEHDRIELDSSADPTQIHDSYISLMAHNTEVPGLVELFTRLSADAVSPDHPAHQYFVVRGRAIRAQLAQRITLLQDAGQLTTELSPQTLARVVQAVSDGLQLQWLLDPTIDMTGTVEQLFQALGYHAHPTSEGQKGTV